MKKKQEIFILVFTDHGAVFMYGHHPTIIKGVFTMPSPSRIRFSNIWIPDCVIMYEVF